MADYNKLVDGELMDEEFQGWEKKEPKSYKDVVLKQIELCRVEGSKQMIGQAELFQRTNVGLQKVSFFDQKKIYMQSVLTFHDLMLRYFDDEVKTALTNIDKKIKDKMEELIKLFTENEPRKDYGKICEKTRELINTPFGTKLINIFEEFKYQQHRKMFQELLLLYDRKNDLSGKRTASIY